MYNIKQGQTVLNSAKKQTEPTFTCRLLLKGQYKMHDIQGKIKKINILWESLSVLFD